jgi:ATP-dependent RNA helicase HelY
MDLVAAEAIRQGLWADLDPSELAAVLSSLVYETRRADDSRPPRLPGGRAKDALRDVVHLWAELDALERDHKVDYLREPDAGFAWAAYRWAEGDALDDVLGVIDLAAGDFVRWMKQLLDLALQVADASAGTPLRDVAREVADRLRRGVVAYSSVS